MRPSSLGAALSLGFALICAGSALDPHAGASGPRAGAASELTWRSDYEGARLEAQQTGKPLFVVFR